MTPPALSVPTTFLRSTSAAGSSAASQIPVSDQASSSNSKGLPVGAIIGIIVGVLALLVALILLRALLKQQKALKTGNGSPHYRDHLIPGFVSTIVSTKSTQSPTQRKDGNEKTPTTWKHEMPATELKEVQELPASERPYELSGSK